MTEQTQPTDAALEALAKDLRERATRCDAPGNELYVLGLREAAEAAINAKWNAALARRLEVTEAECEAAVLELETEDLRPTPQPTQAQAGAVPLTQYRVLEPRVDRIEADDEYLQDDAQTWATDPNGTFVGTIYGYALRAARRRIKGADHG